ncbi:hypothetical protein LXA43DRAFT_903520, partial [Ganoderma leucocontextum]
AGSLLPTSQSLRSNVISGSIYFLNVIAGRRMSFTCARMPWESIRAVCGALRWPSSCALAGDITSRLFPLLKCLAQEVPLSMLSIFSIHVLEDYNLPRTVHCGDLEVTDQVFSTMNNK